jgi:plasmid stabilization system protein ParE
VAAPDRLLRFPELGRVVPEFGQATLRELIVRPYRLVYRLRGEAVEIVTVFHGARMFPDLRE